MPLFNLSTRRLVDVMAICLLSLSAAALAQTTPLLLRNPSLNKDRIAFLYADDIWTVSREGGEARRLTSGSSVAEGPYFSPDGTQIAYSTRQHGLVDVYVVNADGGVPRRLTWEPTGNYAAGWTPDGEDVLFTSMHESYSDFFRLFKTRADGTGSPVVLPLPRRWPMSQSCSGRRRGRTTAGDKRPKSGWSI
jgi:tricorn protease